VEAEGALIQLVTRCGSEEEFIERFARFATETDIVVPALPHVSVGTDGTFVICLKDRSVLMRGRCEVTEIRPVTAPPGASAARPEFALMRLRLREMDAHSAGIHLRLMERHASTVSPPAAPVEIPTAESSAVTVVSNSPLPDTETTEISPLPRPEMRVPGAAFTLPANPLSDLDAADLASFVELKLHESGRVVAGALNVRLDRARHIARRVAPYAACLLAGLLVGMALRSGPKPAPVAVAPAVTLPPVPTPPAVAAPPTDPMPPEAPGTIVAEREAKETKVKKRRRSHRNSTAKD
jgi:hypothetical protein